MLLPHGIGVFCLDFAVRQPPPSAAHTPLMTRIALSRTVRRLGIASRWSCHCQTPPLALMWDPYRHDTSVMLHTSISCNRPTVSLAYLQGSGMSDGDWVTLGAREVDDLAVAVAHLRTLEHVSTIGLWGRSMGAVTALLYARRDPSIAGVVRTPLPPLHRAARCAPSA